MSSGPDSTRAAIAARRKQTQDKLAKVEKAIGQLRRERGRLTIRAIAERAGVSATFLYENTDARTLVKSAVTDSHSRHDRLGQEQHDRIEATWRERALNAEAELTRTQKEVFTQRKRIGEIMGQLSDFDQMVPGESVQQLSTENTTLKHRVQHLTREHRSLQERLEGARSNLRFAEKRTAELEVQVLELQQGRGGDAARSALAGVTLTPQQCLDVE
jgi:chromosome segregation ATPase